MTKKQKIREKEKVVREMAVNYVVLDSNRELSDFSKLQNVVVCRNTKSVLNAIERTSINTLWISQKSEMNSEILKQLVLPKIRGKRKTFGNLLMLDSPLARLRPVLYGLFGRVVGASQSFKLLPNDQLAHVLALPMKDRRDLVIGGVLDRELEILTLVRGNLESLSIPLSIFIPSGLAQPDFTKFSLDDYGNTIQFGNYESTTDVVLWECDADYRKRAVARQKANAKGFGASLRRLRKQRGLSQSDFPNIERRTISRLESGGVERPHTITRNRIAKTLGVEPDEIESY